MRLCHVLFFIALASVATAPLAMANNDIKTNWGEWQNARSLYDAGKYQEALAAFKATPNNDASYFYNLGNVYYRLGQVGIAVAHLEKANRQRPHDPDIQYNLKIARQALAQHLGQERIDSASTWFENIADNAPLDETRAIIGLIAFIITLFWLAAYRRNRSVIKTLLQPSGIIGLIALTMTAGVYFTQRITNTNPPAICLENQSIRSGPGEQFMELTKMEPGEKIRLLGPSEQTNTEVWRQIRYMGDKIGWIRASSLLPL